ncbi:hypothetical protein GALMADRAFT_159374 [Galerina marginata CBS 339.88]|uniref:Methyltransferase type 11 domain-containing protein n=1 Tax=Galerina marginata (strain CBS 339.88) TaxID=685588 RepID=A0A067SKS8_GALM3|nr:hypothetical protein GALMADRAFT_159374 [Galerina marginata CBS 339.88]
MKLSAIFKMALHVLEIARMGLPSTLKAVFYNPRLLFQPAALSRIFLGHVWLVMGEPMDMNSSGVKDSLITPNAVGVVLDIGAGHGHTVKYLNRAVVTKYIALEPNVGMHTHIRTHANAAGFHESDATLIILSHGAEDTQSILSSLHKSLPKDAYTSHGGKLIQPVDTVVSVRTLCTVPSPQKTIANLVRDILKPGGKFLIYEHVLSELKDVAWWQRFWTPVWSSVFDGCKLDRPTDAWVKDLKINLDGEEKPAWTEGKSWKVKGDPSDVDNLFCHRAGRFVKA